MSKRNGSVVNAFPCPDCHWGYEGCVYRDYEGLDLRSLAPRNLQTGMCGCFKDLILDFSYKDPVAQNKQKLSAEKLGIFEKQHGESFFFHELKIGEEFCFSLQFCKVGSEEICAECYTKTANKDSKVSSSSDPNRVGEYCKVSPDARVIFINSKKVQFQKTG